MLVAGGYSGLVVSVCMLKRDSCMYRSGYEPRMLGANSSESDSISDSDINLLELDV